MPSTMKAVVKTKREPGAELQQVEIPRPGPTDALVKVEVAAICGSDAHRYHWTPAVAASNLKLPLILGHEYSGKVVELGPQVRSLKIGDRVAGETHIPCQRCWLCKTGKEHICKDMKCVGTHVHGCFADYVVIPESALRRVPDGLSAEQAAMLEPLGVAVHAVTRAEVSGKNVAVLGCGPIGLFAVAVAKALGALKVLATSRSESKRALALKMGADAALDAEAADLVAQVLAQTPHDVGGVDAIIELSGSPIALKQAFRMLRNGGRIICVGHPQSPVTLELSNDIIYREAELIGIFGREMWQTWHIAESLLLSNQVDITPVLSARYPLAQFPAAFAAQAKLPGKVLLIP